MGELDESLLERGDKENHPPLKSFSEHLQQTRDAFGTGVPRALRIAGLTVFVGWAVVELAAGSAALARGGYLLVTALTG
jgi:hypothetical protein